MKKKLSIILFLLILSSCKSQDLKISEEIKDVNTLFFIENSENLTIKSQNYLKNLGEMLNSGNFFNINEVKLKFFLHINVNDEKIDQNLPFKRAMVIQNFLIKNFKMKESQFLFSFLKPYNEENIAIYHIDGIYLGKD